MKKLKYISLVLTAIILSGSTLLLSQAKSYLPKNFLPVDIKKKYQIMMKTG